jgi:hypothetical protein
VEVVIKKTIRHDRLGLLKPGRKVEMDDTWARKYLAQNAVERYETKVIREVPLGADGRAAQSSVLPADPASQRETVIPLGNGVYLEMPQVTPKKRGRPRKVSSP